MKVKDFRAEVKAAGGDGLPEGGFEALVSVFGNEDSVGDVVMPGAFTKTIADWTASGDPIPVVWSHKWDDPFSHIGHVTDATESDRGLVVKGQLDLDNPTAQQVHKLLKARRVKQFSFAYDVEDGGWGERDGRDVYELRELKLHEVGPCLLGANQETDLIAAKAQVLVDGTKAGRVLSSKNYDALKAAHESIGQVLAAAEPEDEPKTSTPSGVESKTDEPSQADGSPADDELTGAKSDQAATSVTRRALAVARITNLAS